MYRTNLGAPPSPRETGLGKDGGAATNGGGGGGSGHERSSNGVGVEGAGTLADTVQEAEDLEALLTGQRIISGMNGGGASHPTVDVTPPA